MECGLIELWHNVASRRDHYATTPKSEKLHEILQITDCNFDPYAEIYRLKQFERRRCHSGGAVTVSRIRYLRHMPFLYLQRWDKDKRKGIWL